MSATHRDLTWSVVVADHDQQPGWLKALVELTGTSCDDLVVAMIRNEMNGAGQEFLSQYPELFMSGTGLV